MTLKGTTICAVKKDGRIAVAGDGQVTMGESTIFKATAHKVRRIYGGKVVTGFAGTVSDAFALCDRFEAKLEQFSGNLERAAVELAQEWRSDKAMRKLEAMLIVASGETTGIPSCSAMRRTGASSSSYTGPTISCERARALSATSVATFAGSCAVSKTSSRTDRPSRRSRSTPSRNP